MKPAKTKSEDRIYIGIPCCEGTLATSEDEVSLLGLFSGRGRREEEFQAFNFRPYFWWCGGTLSGDETTRLVLFPPLFTMRWMEVRWKQFQLCCLPGGTNATGPGQILKTTWTTRGNHSPLPWRRSCSLAQQRNVDRTHNFLTTFFTTQL